MKDLSSVEMSSLDQEGIPLEFETEEEYDETNNLKNEPCVIFLMILFSLLIITFGGIFIYTVYLKTQKFTLIITKNDYEIVERASAIIANLIKKKPNASLGLISGSTTTEGIYSELIKKNKNNEISFRYITTYNIAEYAGFSRNNKESFYHHMKTHFFDNIDINPNNYHFPDIENDIEKGKKDYDNLIKNAKIDLQLLGVGTNGHIGLNEPGTSFESTVHVVNLSDRVIKHFSKLFEGDENKVPRLGVTFGIKNILSADTIVLYASGVRKAEAIKALMEGKVDVNIPVTALNVHKGKVIVICDQDAASLL